MVADSVVCRHCFTSIDFTPESVVARKQFWEAGILPHKYTFQVFSARVHGVQGVDEVYGQSRCAWEHGCVAGECPYEVPYSHIGLLDLGSRS